MIKFARLLLVTLFIVSCGDTNLFMTLSNSEDAILFKTSINSGDILNPEFDTTIDISMEYDETIVEPDKLEIAFLDLQGLEISEPQIIEGNKLNEVLPPLSVSSPEDNLYYIRLRAFDYDGIILKEKIIPFFYSSNTFSIRGIVAYPNVFVPGGQGLIFPDVEATSDSWIRWSIDNEVIGEGFLSEYANGFIWKTPLLEGVYGLRMELFPVEPLYTTNGTFSFSSSLSSDIEIFVTKTNISGSSNLFPEKSYSTLMHFNGIIENIGTIPINIIPIGLPELSRQCDELGFYLDGKSGYIIDSNILPVDKGLLMPFSITFSLCITEQQKDRSFLSIAGNKDEWFYIKTNSFGILETELFHSSGSSKGVSNIRPEDYKEITLSVIPEKDTISFSWYGDGRLISSEISDYNPEVPNLLFKSIISGNNGFKGFIDEFGIYYQDEKSGNNIDDNIFKRRVNRKYNSEKIIAAYGFDGLHFSDIHNHLLPVLSGSLILNSESEFQFLKTDFSFSYLFMDFDFEQLSSESEIQIHFPDDSFEKIVHINLGYLAQSPDGSKNLNIEFTIRNGFLEVLYNGTIIAKEKVQTDQVATFYLINNSENDTKISSLLVRREEKRVVEGTVKNLETKLLKN